MPLKAAVAAGEAQVFTDPACLAELERVLAYPLGRHSIDIDSQLERLDEVRSVSTLIENVLSEEERKALPLCSDSADQKFLEAALVARADFLVTKDRALLELARRKRRPLPFRIVTPGGVPAS